MKTLGLKRLTVKLLPHNAKWKDAFEIEARKLKTLFPSVEQIGSTAIKGIRAKPIIDMIAGIPSMGQSSDYVEPLKKLGYTLLPFGGATKQLFFAKGKDHTTTHYLHLIKLDGKIWENDLFFRDYLNAHKKAAKEYEKLKTTLAEKFADKRLEYTRAKWHFIKSILAKRKR